MVMIVRLCTIASCLLAVVACDDVPFGRQGAAVDLDALPVDPTLCDVVANVFEPRCVSCHGDGGQAPLLTSAAAAAIVGAPAALYPNATLVVAGDADASLLYRKVHGPAPDEGAQMPFGEEMEPALVELVKTWINAGAPVACDAPSAEPPGDESPVGAEPPPAADDAAQPAAPTVCTVLNARCTQCHAGNTAPDLRASAVASGALVGVASPRYGGRTLVVAGDVAASFLFTKIAGTQVAGEGARMPLGGTALDAAQLDVVRAWIEAGAPVDACDAPDGDLPADGLGPVDLGIVPGGPIAVTGTPEGYGATPPSFAAGASCSTQQWWQHADDEEAAISMHPGRACIDCHSSSGDSNAPRFTWAGTVMNDLRDEDDCRGVPGVQVDILDANDDVIRSATTSLGGNFGIVFAGGLEAFRVRLTYEGRTREMLGHQSSTGDCMSCHTATGANGAPGRIVVP